MGEGDRKESKLAGAMRRDTEDLRRRLHATLTCCSKLWTLVGTQCSQFTEKATKVRGSLLWNSA